MKQEKIFLVLLILCGVLVHIWGLSLNEVLKVADSFAYLQMTQHLHNFHSDGLGTGWFGFVYSLCIGVFHIFISDPFFAAKVCNIFLLLVSSLLFWKLSRKFLCAKYSLLALGLFIFSPTLFHFRIHVLSENIYIPLFLGLCLALLRVVSILPEKKTHELIAPSIGIGCIVGLMYLTRAEAFIYLAAVGIIAGILFIHGKIQFKKLLALSCSCLLGFVIFISPYLFHLHTLTGEWTLTNKGSSNLRQAQLRGIEQMDDDGFEKAVAELSADKSQLIAGFAGGMDYVRPLGSSSLIGYLLNDPIPTIQRIYHNSQKLYFSNLPEIFLGKSPKLFHSDDPRFNNLLFFLYICIPWIFLIYGYVYLWQKHNNLTLIISPFWGIASLFFVLFFTLNRYFIIFFPFACLFFTAGVQSFSKYRFVQLFATIQILSLIALSFIIYITIESPKDARYELKKEAGLWLKNHHRDHENIRMMERFPITTYYAGSMHRYITPYTDIDKDILSYARINNIDYLVVDTMDFYLYRKKLRHLLSQEPVGFTLLKEFTHTEGGRVIIYQRIK